MDYIVKNSTKETPWRLKNNSMKNITEIKKTFTTRYNSHWYFLLKAPRLSQYFPSVIFIKKSYYIDFIPYFMKGGWEEVLQREMRKSKFYAMKFYQSVYL